MATLRLLDDDVTLLVELTGLEHAETLHRDVRFARSAVTAVRRVEHAMEEVHGVRAPGTGVPGVIQAGTYRARGTTTFAVCHGRGPGVVIDLAGHDIDRVVLTLDDPDGAVSMITG